MRLDYGDLDPAISLPTSTVSLWFKLMSSSEVLRRRAAKAWPRVLKGLQEAKPHQRWRKINGVMAGTIFVLQSAGWTPTGPWDWTHPCGDRYAVSEEEFQGDPDWEPFLEVFRETLRLWVWTAAAEHYNGKGLQCGVETADVSRMMRSLAKRGANKFRGALSTVMSAGYWPRDRLEKAGVKVESVPEV